MANEVFINIKDLPQLTEINNGDYIVVETSTGTHIIDFLNFLIPPANNVLTTTVSDNTTAVINISSVVVDNSNKIDSLSTDLTNSVNTTVGALADTIDQLAAAVVNLSYYNTYNGTLYMGKCQISINAGSKTGVNILFPVLSTTGVTLDKMDILVTPANLYASRFGVFVDDVTSTSVVRLKGGFTRYDVSGSPPSITLVDIPAEQDALYNVIAFKRV